MEVLNCTFLCPQLLSQVRTSSEPQIAALKPFLLKRFLTHIFQVPMDSIMPGKVTEKGMMSEVISWARHSLYSRKHAWRAVEDKVMLAITPELILNDTI